MNDDIAINKAAIIRRCLERVNEEYRGDPRRLDDFTTQDSVVLNLLRACEAAIDLAMHHVARGKLGVPQSSRDAFALLHQAGQIHAGTAAAMSKMVGFRNVAVHAYQKLERPILEAILEGHLDEFNSLIRELENG